MDDFPILQSSAKAMQGRSKYNFPFDTIECGQSFKIMNKASIKIVTLRPLAYRKALQLGRRFRVIEHDDCYEVARVK